MTAFEGLWRFGTLSEFVSASYTTAVGTTPGICRVITPPVKGIHALGGTMEFRYGPVRLVFPDCRVDQIEIIQDDSGREMWELTIMDRRWRWRTAGEISGSYNTRLPGDKIDPAGLRSAQDLAKMIVKAMKEPRADLSAVPKDVWPAADWHVTNPAEALDNLLDALGLAAALGTDNRLRIVRPGIGRLPPPGDISGSFEINPPDAPETITIYCPIEYQEDLELEAVGRDRDGKIKPIDELSYTPMVGGKRSWAYADIEDMMTVDDPADRYHARETVFRWYRVKTPYRSALGGRVVKSLREILPLYNRQTERVKDGDEDVYLPPWVYGVFYAEDDVPEADPDVVPPVALRKPEGIYEGGFSLDTENGIVKFNKPVYNIKPDVRAPYGMYILPAQLYLRAAHHFYEGEGRIAVKHGRTLRLRQTPNITRKKKAEPFDQFLFRNDIVREIYIARNAIRARVVDTKAAADKELEYYLRAEAAKYVPAASGNALYAGLLPFSLDGIIRQITWTIDDSGYCTTQLSANTEYDLVFPTYKERRLYTRIDEALRKAEDDKRRAKVRAAK